MSELEKLYGQKIRVRVCGIIRRGDSILLVGHKNLVNNALFWSPPGGGVDFGETSIVALKRELEEETGLTDLIIKELLFFTEYIKPPLHAIELFFEVIIPEDSIPFVGKDPEFKEQLLTDLQFIPFQTIKSMPVEQVHGLFRHCDTIDALYLQKGLLQ